MRHDRILRAALLGISLTLWALPALAQSPYVAAAVGIDISRLGHTEAFGFDDARPDGEAVAWSLRLGTAVSRRWGVDLAFTRPEEVSRDLSRGYPVPLLTRLAEAGVVEIPPVPIRDLRMRLERRNTTLDATGWVAQRFGQRLDLVYLAGVSFARVVEDLDLSGSGRGFIVPGSTRTTSYDLGPVVGTEARIALTDHAFLVPSLRLSGIDGPSGNGWLLRTAVGLGWRF